MSEEKKELERQKRAEREKALDDFWNVDALIPARRAPHYPSNTDTAEILLEPIEGNDGAKKELSERLPKREELVQRRFIPPHSAAEENGARPDEAYSPQSSLIRQVRLYKWKSEYRYYEAFVRDANRLLAVHGKPCAQASFFSYVPQYSQMSLAQLEWYLWWRENIREGNALQTDYSYLLLYAYELINLSLQTEPNYTQQALLRLWRNYRTTFRQLDSILPEWICDHGLIHRLPAPAGLSSEERSALMSHCNLREYYVPTGKERGYVRALMTFCSNYDPYKSKFYGEGREALFESLIPEALSEVVDRFSGDGKLFSEADMDDSTMLRDAYAGAVCSFVVKRRIEVVYSSFSRSHELRYLITDVVKYSENRLRAHLGVRSRLSVYALPVAVREVLDAFFAQRLGTRTAPPVKKEEPPAYERLYDHPGKPFSFSEAARIEADSWSVTQRLTEAFDAAAEDAAGTPEKTFEKTVEKATEQEDASFLPESAEEIAREGGEDALWLPYLAFLRCVYEGDAAGARREAAARGVLLDLLADEVNSVAVELTGDLLLEERDGAYEVIEDYVETVREILAYKKGEV